MKTLPMAKNATYVSFLLLVVRVNVFHIYIGHFHFFHEMHINEYLNFKDRLWGDLSFFAPSPILSKPQPKDKE